MQREDENGASARQPLDRTIAAFLRFYAPLAIQGISQTLTLPLVGSVVAHGRLGPSEYAVFAQSQGLMILVSSAVGSLVTTGMIFGRCRTGMRNFVRLSLLMGLAAVALQLLLCLPPLDGWLFGRVYNLGGELFAVGRDTLLYSIPQGLASFVCAPFVACLFSERRTDLATLATFLRIALTFAGSVALVHFGLVGWAWGVALATLGVLLETSLCWCFSRRYVAALVDAPGCEIASTLKQGLFTLPLSLGVTLLNFTTVVNAALLTATPNPEVSRALHYIVLGVINPLSAACARLQSFTIAFAPEKYGMRRLNGFVAAVGAFMVAVSFAMQVPAVANWYFGGVQNLSAETVPLAMQAMLVGAPIPFLMAFRSHAEGLAALRRRPNVTLASQAAYLATLIGVFLLLIRISPIPGFMMSIASIGASQLVSFLTIFLALRRPLRR